ncbi:MULTISPECIES: flagellin [Corallincola]|uniref:Flagellin n=2 Tax=Corallincola TaxID=1775176 RepID=A0ABY1WKL1_9GAMM|nr:MULTISPECIES: flagellin [Corallincola]TAA40329.1 flagellin [Corallincola spongiicola]TCI05364.1 flagellin [Corallincola luteus]
MALTIQTNVSSLNAQRNLNQSNSALGTNFERLSSGLRINSAADDAAGLQISNRLTSQINGLNIATRNANDANSLSQTAEGALQESTNILQRMRDLSIQSANGTFSDSDRGALQEEVNQLQDELDRIADTTTFGDRKLLDGSFGTESFQVGAQAFETVAVSINSFQTESMGAQTYELLKTEVGGSFTGVAVSEGTASVVTGSASAIGLGGIGVSTAATADATFGGTALTNSANTLNVSGELGSATINVDGSASAGDIAKSINDQSQATGVNADARTVVALDFYSAGGSFAANSSGTINTFGGALTGTATLTFSLRGANDDLATAPTIKVDITNTEDLSSLANAINAVADETGVGANVGDDGRLVLTSEGGDTIQIDNLQLTGVGSTVGIDAATYEFSGDTDDTANIASYANLVATTGSTIADAAAVGDSAADFVGTIRLTANGDFNVQANTQAGASALSTTILQNASLGAGAELSQLDSVDNIDISTAIGAQEAVSVIDGALSYIDSQRASLGAVQNRLDSTISNLSNISENASNSRSGIRDTDFAEETSELSKNQVLTQAATSVLAQANQLPQAALSLLG